MNLKSENLRFLKDVHPEGLIKGFEVIFKQFSENLAFLKLMKEFRIIGLVNSQF
jgi:hypothetical protein